MISYVIPTLGTRPIALNKLIRSLLKSNFVEKIVVVGPIDVEETIKIYESRIQFVKEHSNGAPAAINQGLNEIESKFWNWIGDDDFIDGSNLDEFFLTKKPISSHNFYYTNIKYVDIHGNFLMWNNPKNIARKLIYFGPNLIPQPTCLFPTLTSVSIGGISQEYHFAFDQDFICRLLLHCKAEYVSHNFASYTWHGNSLTQKHRFLSLKESYQIRKKYSINWLNRIIVKALYLPTVLVVLLADFIFGVIIRKRHNV
jgi:hypothetical protein